MEKTISINLSGQNFQIEEDAYDKLKTYLENIKRHCGAGADSAEVIADIENSMAEKLKASLTPYKEVITMENIDSLISVMGTVEDFDREIGGTPESSDQPEADKDPAKDSVKRRLYRDVDNRLLGGVAAGLGAYFGIDPVIFRLLFVALVFAGGFGIALYLLFWLIIPAARSAHQKLEMQGEAPTIAAFERLSKKSVAWKDDLKRRWRESSWLKKIISFPFLALECLFRALKKVWSKLWPVIKIFFGLGLVVFSLFSLGIIGVASVFALLENNSAYHLSYIPITEITAVFPFFLVLFTALLSLAIPVLFLLFAGLIIIRRKNFLNFTVAAILIGVWMIAGIACVSLTLRYAPDIRNKIDNYPKVQTTSQSVSVGALKNINIDDNGQKFRVIIEPGATSTVSLNGRLADIEKVEVKNDGDNLAISSKTIEEPLCLFCNLHPVTIRISAPLLNSLKVSGGSVDIKKGLKQLSALEAKDNSSVDIETDGGQLNALAENMSLIGISGKLATSTLNIDDGEIHLKDFEGGMITLNLLNADADSRLQGTIKELIINSNQNVTVGSIINARELTVDKTTLNIQGAPRISLASSKEININLSDEAVLYYSGQPKFIGNTKDKKIMRYQEISKSEYRKERTAEEDGEEISGSETDQIKDYKLYSDDGNGYFRLYQGDLNKDNFLEMSDSF